MIYYIVRRVLIAIPTLLVIAAISFLLMHIAPGGPFDVDKQIPEDVLSALNAKYHLDKSLLEQFWIFVCNFAKGDFGLSYVYKDFTVTELVKQSWPVSFELGIWAYLSAILMGVTMGVLAALKQNSRLDYFVMTLAMTGIVVPNFVVAPLLVMVFSVMLDLLPAGGWNEGQWEYLILPVIALSLGSMATIARIMRASMIEILNSQYIRSANSRGLGKFYIIIRHALRPAFIPLIGYLGPLFVYIITGSIIIDVFFTTGGLGQHFVYGALNRDYGLIMGITMLIAVLTITFNAMVDIVYALIDPRIRL